MHHMLLFAREDLREPEVACSAVRYHCAANLSSASRPHLPSLRRMQSAAATCEHAKTHSCPYLYTATFIIHNHKHNQVVAPSYTSCNNRSC